VKPFIVKTDYKNLIGFLIIKKTKLTIS